MITTTIEPPPTQWRLSPGDQSLRAQVIRSVNLHGALGGQLLVRADRIISTGHQAWFWHPGILAKDLAMIDAAERLSARCLHLVADHDAHEALRLDVPVRDGHFVRSVALRLGPEDIAVPTGSRDPASPSQVVSELEAARERWGDRLLVDLRPLIVAWRDAPPARTLAEQITAVKLRLMEPQTGRLPVVFASDLMSVPEFIRLFERMLVDARRCVACYNRSVARHPEARVAPLIEEPDRVELPLWAVARHRERRRVYADLADRVPVFTLDTGEPIHPWSNWAGGVARKPSSVGEAFGTDLAPRALMLTVLMRRYVCDLFIHGKGGGVYDRITEEWWREWTGEELAPMAVVSADVRLDFRGFDVPLAEPKEVERAVWWRHHVRHNVDRAVNEDGPLVARKREILEHMDDDRDPRRRAALFAELHRIDKRLAEAHPEVIADADRAVDRAKTGLINRQIAMKRDWFFGLYPPEKLEALRRAIAGSAEASQLPGAGGVQSATP